MLNTCCINQMLGNQWSDINYIQTSTNFSIFTLQLTLAEGKCKLNIMEMCEDERLAVFACIYLCLYVCEWLMAEEGGEGLPPGGLAGLLATVQWSLLLLSLTHITTSLTLNRPPIFLWPIAFGTVCSGAVWIITLLHNEDWTIMKRNTVSTNYKIKFVYLSLLSGWLIFSSFFKRGAQCCTGQACGARVKWQTQGG